MADEDDKLAEKAGGTDGVESSKRLKPYKAPTLQRFGTLSRLTQGSTGPTGDGGGTKKAQPPPSDRRLKRNVVRLGTLPMGIGLYLFDYNEALTKPAELGRQLGVMADEVVQVIPEAISVSLDGYKHVDYSLLEIQPADVIAAFNS